LLLSAELRWPAALRESPMHEPHKAALRAHWQALHGDFRIER
jgi:serine/threonine-protein kinase HipA